MSGQHRRHSKDIANASPSRLRSALPLIAGITVAALLVTGAFLSLRLGGPKPTANTAQPTASAVDDRSADVQEDRADRSELRAAPTPAASDTPTPKVTTVSPTPTKTPTKTQPPGSGDVTLTGTCGMSYYDTGTTTANGERFDPNGFTAAHKTWAFDTRVRVTNPANGKSVIVRINDRGPFVGGRCVDLAKGAFVAIASLNTGVITARYEVLK